ERVLGGARVGQRALGRERDEGVQPAVELLDAGQQCARDLHRRELARAVARAQLADGRVADLGGHGRPSPPALKRTAGSTVLLARQSRARTCTSASLSSLRTMLRRWSAIVSPAARRRAFSSSSVSS